MKTKITLTDWEKTIYDISYDKDGNEIKKMKPHLTRKELYPELSAKCDLCGSDNCFGNCFK